MDLSPYHISEEDHTTITQAIHNAEKKGSYEIRICIDKTSDIDLFDRAAYIFEKLKMHKTRYRNGVLIYVSLSTKRFCIIGDKKAHEKFSQSFWDQTADQTQNLIRTNGLLDGILYAIQAVQDALAKYFPPSKDDENELSNEIHFEE